MRPFELSEGARALTGIYPKADEFREIARSATQEEKYGIVRQWSSEGIPFAFTDCPLLYEAVREWLGRRINVHPKEITLIGSARIGYSMAPPPEYGRPFGAGSDLDFSAISVVLFQECAAAFELWRTNYTSGTERPHGSKEKFYWDANLAVVPKNIRRGFVDAKKIPLRDSYPIASKIEQSMYLLQGKLDETDCAPTVRSCSVRVYKDWRAFIAQMQINLRAAVEMQ